MLEIRIPDWLEFPSKEQALKYGEQAEVSVFLKAEAIFLLFDGSKEKILPQQTELYQFSYLKEKTYDRLGPPSHFRCSHSRTRCLHVLLPGWGGDAVGMSTACEAMAARHMGMEICGISCITNMAAGISQKELNHKEVQETADRVAKSFKELVTKVVVNM